MSHCDNIDERKAELELLAAAFSGSDCRTEVSVSSDRPNTPWECDDLEWFTANPKRTARIRAAMEGEWEDAANRVVMIWRGDRKKVSIYFRRDRITPQRYTHDRPIIAMMRHTFHSRGVDWPGPEKQPWEPV